MLLIQIVACLCVVSSLVEVSYAFNLAAKNERSLAVPRRARIHTHSITAIAAKKTKSKAGKGFGQPVPEVQSPSQVGGEQVVAATSAAATSKGGAVEQTRGAPKDVDDVFKKYGISTEDDLERKRIEAKAKKDKKDSVSWLHLVFKQVA